MRVLTVTEVRQHLYWASGGPRSAGAGEPSTALLGSIFHALYGALTGPDAQLNLVAPLELADASVASWRQALVDHAFATVVAPALAQHEMVLQAGGAEVLGFWTAAKELCGWLAELMHSHRAADTDRSLAALRKEIFAGSEVDLEVELTDSQWPEAILLQGRADAVLVRRFDAKRCVVEFKLGRTHPEADLLQGCLYHLMFTQSDSSEGDAALAMVSFEPQPRETLLEAAQLRQAQQDLKGVLAELAGFDRRPSPPIVSPPKAASIAPVASDALQEIRRKLTAAFAEYGAALTIANDAACGPAFIRFFATPARGVSVTRVSQLAKNVWMRIGTSQSPQVTLSKGRVAIDVERPDRQRVDFSAWRSALPERSLGGLARFAVGVSVDGKLHFADLSESQSPHLLVVGTTGSGKSEWLRAFLASLMVTNSTATLRLALIDPKRLAFPSLDRSTFLWRPIVYDEGAIRLFDDLIEEMERRYTLLQQAGVDDLTRYNELNRGRGGDGCPRIVCVCDEFADLLLRDKTTRKAIEERVARLGVKGRAAGVHLVFATQRAGREILKGTIDSNLPARVALSVPRETDSRLVLGEPGAETLLGKGDLLYKDIGAPVRLQGLLVTREELAALATA
jgi:S-DNA-T family DNA segregation ATPase FtsK/SpoIIIE